MDTMKKMQVTLYLGQNNFFAFMLLMSNFHWSEQGCTLWCCIQIFPEKIHEHSWALGKMIHHVVVLIKKEYEN